MAPKIGFEPTSYFQLPLAPFVAERDTWANLERIVRLKLTSLAWKAKAQSLYHTRIILFIVATRTGLEPATSSVTGWCSNQLNYRAMVGQ